MRLPSAKSRPDEVSTWMETRSYASTQVPFICDVGVYSGTWITWWASCQPAWRQNKGWPLPRDGSATWGAKSWAHGHNGLFLVVMSTAWWASSIQSAKDWVEFESLMKLWKMFSGCLTNLSPHSKPFQHQHHPHAPISPRYPYRPKAQPGWLVRVENISPSRLIGCWRGVVFEGIFDFVSLTIFPDLRT